MAMKETTKLTPAFVLRIGLGLTLLYAGAHMIGDTVTWAGFIPPWMYKIVSPSLFLTIHGIGELLLGALFLAGLFLPAISLLTFLDMLSIMVFYGVDDISFRDFGLMMAALALFLLSRNTRKKETE